jgi:hypothetical protein
MDRQAPRSRRERARRLPVASQWGGGFADWCLSESMRIHAGGNRAFIGALIRDLAVRNVVVARR